MHELPVTESILDIVVRHAQANGVRQVVAINLRVGEMSDLEDEWIQRYFDYLSRDTVAQGAKLRIERVPVVIRCTGCGQEYEVNVRAMGDSACPECRSSKGELISGREYYIKDMEVR